MKTTEMKAAEKEVIFALKQDYTTPASYYVATKAHSQAAFRLLMCSPTPEEENACYVVVYSHSYRKKVHQDFIHIIDEYIKKENLKAYPVQ